MTMVALAMALGALLLGAPHFQESPTPALAPKTSETPALQQQQQHATFLPSGPDDSFSDPAFTPGK